VELPQVQPNGWAHRAGKRAGANISAFDSHGPSPQHGLDNRPRVLDQLIHGEPNLAHRTWMLPALSILYSTRPALTSLTALAVSSVTVPVLGLGINPRGPSTFPSFRTSAMASGVATATSKSAHPSWHFLINSSNPTCSSPRPAPHRPTRRLGKDQNAHDFATAMR